MSSFDENGLIIDSLNTIITNLETGLQSIYGSDINLDSNSPDGQAVNLFAQAIRDILELLQQINSSFDLGQAIGIILDQRTSVLGIIRQGATFTFQSIDVTVDRNLTLIGLDENANELPENLNGDEYTVADDEGNQFILLDTTPLTPGTATLTFRAANLGAITTLENTITNPVTIIQGVTAINNPTSQSTTGVNGELDAAYRNRSLISSGLPSQSYQEGLTASLLNTTGVTEAVVYENDTNVTDSSGTPAHTIWCIIEGGSNDTIADVILLKKTPGAGTRGNVSVEKTLSTGQLKTINFDRPVSKELYIRFGLQEIIEGQIFDEDLIKQNIVNNLTYAIGEAAQTSKITTIAQQAIDDSGGGGVPLNVEVSANGSDWFDFLNVDTVDERWVADISRITITIL